MDVKTFYTDKKAYLFSVSFLLLPWHQFLLSLTFCPPVFTSPDPCCLLAHSSPPYSPCFSFSHLHPSFPTLPQVKQLGQKTSSAEQGTPWNRKKKFIYIYTYLISGDEVRLYREIIQLHLCSFHLHGENKKNESSAWVDIGIRQQKAFLSVSTAWGILRKTLGCISDLCLPSPSTFFFQSLCAFHVRYSFSQSELCFSSLQHFVRRMSLSVPTMNVCHVNFGVMDKQIAVTPQMSGTVVSSCHGIFCLKVMSGLMAVLMY